MTKAEWREQQRKLPFAEKLRILEQLRLRDLEIGAAPVELLKRRSLPSPEGCQSEGPGSHTTPR